MQMEYNISNELNQTRNTMMLSRHIYTLVLFKFHIRYIKSNPFIPQKKFQLIYSIEWISQLKGNPPNQLWHLHF